MNFPVEHLADLPLWQKVLEWDRFIELAQKEARSFPAKQVLEDLRDTTTWAEDVTTARLMQQETQETTALLDRDALWGPLLELPEPSDLLERLSKGSILEIEELALLRRWLYAIDSWIQTPREEIRGETIRMALAQMPNPYNPLRILELVLTPEGTLSEKASPKLAALYSEIRSLRREIGSILDQLLKTFSQKGILQENFTDVRDGRYVIPIKISCQNEIDGIIYEASASRQTVFVEPKEVGALNNRLRQKQNDLLQEIYIILTETSKKLFPFLFEIEESIEVLIHWDTIQAKARLGRHYSGKPIQVTNERTFFLKQTAHPLLWWSLPPESIIRNEIEFGHPTKTLLLTGPNTGGKTVLLKTLGLAGICARTGFPFPATDFPIVPFFDSFFADLGDPQSIEQHLSSFSGHVLRFKEILDHTSEASLILIDELNSATDPEEGAAFGRAVLETLMTKPVMMITTTHDPHLKALAVSDSRILNASMAFDESSRTPTYKMVLGVPGRSRALETAERLGIPRSIIELARSYLSREHNEFEKMLAKLETDLQETAQAKKEAVQLKLEAQHLKKEWTQRTETSVQAMMDRTRQKLRRILEQAQDEVRACVKKLDEIKNRRDTDQTRTHLNAILQQTSSKMDVALEQEAPEIAQILSSQKKSQDISSIPGEKLMVGATVRVPKWKSTGTILEVSEGKVKVALGTLQISLPSREVEWMAAPQKPSFQTKGLAQGLVKISGLDSTTVPSSLDLRGVRFEEAMSRLEHYLDQAYRSGNQLEVTLIHGLGTGALREGAHQILRKLPYIKSFRDGGAGHGGAGATIVEFDR